MQKKEVAKLFVLHEHLNIDREHEELVGVGTLAVRRRRRLLLKGMGTSTFWSFWMT